MQYDLRKAGEKEGSDFLKQCAINATTETEKKACFSNPKAKELFANASGLRAGDIKEIDMVKAGREQATKDVRDMMDACVSAAADDTEKKDCRKRDDLKTMIANS